VHAESFESSGRPSACASADCMSQRCGSITARSRARAPFWDVRCLREVLTV
jgi:hypothetical protein